MVSSWALACFCLLVSQLVVVSSSIVDENDNIDSTAKIVCKTIKGTAYQLGHISTIGKLVNFLENVSENNQEFFECRSKYLESLVELNYLLTTANEDVCGDEKLRLIESYHQRFVTKVVDGPKAPKVANLLFMQYAKRVSSICEQQAVKVLKQTWREVKPEELTKLDKMRQFTDALGMSDLSKGYDGIYLFWNMVDSLPLDKNENIAKYISKSGDIRVNVQLKDPRPVLGLQALCQYKLYPIYSHSILPVLRMVNMGYYPESKQLIDEIKQDPYTTSMFIQTQVCETLARVKVFADETLEEGKIVAITSEDAATLPSPAKLPGVEKFAESKKEQNLKIELSYLVGLDQLVDNGEAEQEINKIKSLVKSRAKVMNRMIKTLMANLKGKLKSKIKNLYLGDKNSAPQDLQESLSTQLEGVNEIEAFDEDDDDNEESPARHRRGIKKTLKAMGKIFISYFLRILLIIYVAILLCIKLALLLIPTLIYWYLYDHGKVGTENAFVSGLSWLWGVGFNLRDPLKSNFDVRKLVDPDNHP